MNLKKIAGIALLMVGLALSSFAQKKQNDKAENVSVVYFCSEITPENILKLYNALNVDLQNKNVGLKVHFGEPGNQNFLSPELLRPLVSKVQPTFVESNVVYPGPRRTTESHIKVAKEHGFTFAPIDIQDAEGEMIFAGDPNFKHCKTIHAGSHFDNYDAYIIYSHFKGHRSSGFGGAIKNVGMGMASPGGKMAIHTKNYPIVKNGDKCTGCQRCVHNCAGNAIAITENGPTLDTNLCVGCAKCLAECPLRIFAQDHSDYSELAFLEKLVEYTKVMMDRRPMYYINVLANISTVCDCSSKAPKPFVRDIGAVASLDIVAIDQACQDLTSAVYGCDHVFEKVNNVSGIEQLKYAEQLGMGNTQYILVDVSTGKQITLQEAVKNSGKFHNKK